MELGGIYKKGLSCHLYPPAQFTWDEGQKLLTKTVKKLSRAN